MHAGQARTCQWQAARSRVHDLQSATRGNVEWSQSSLQCVPQLPPSGINEGSRSGIRGRRQRWKFTAHEGGFKGRFLPTVSLLPTSTLAMRGNRYPITEIGIKTLTKRLIEKGTRDRKLGICKVRSINGAKVKDRVCTMLEVRHDDRKPQFDFHLARIFVDNELNLPIRYEAYDWPTTAGADPQLIEEYTYMNLQINTGLSDEDFSTTNSQYRF